MLKNKILFKYRKFDKGSLEMLLNQEIWFASPASLNDPFEGESSCAEVLEAVWKNYQLPQQEQHKYSEMIHDMLKNSGVCSFSKTRKNQLMWAHYADEHKGICIGFKEEQLRPIGSNIYPIDINYQSDYPYKGIIERIKHFKNIPNNNDIKDITGDILLSLLGTKYSSWSYEKERRLVFYRSEAKKFSPSAVNSIAFGLRMSERDRITIRTLLSGDEWNHIQWYQAIKSKTKYALNFERL